jgi:hypothetical protein
MANQSLQAEKSKEKHFTSVVDDSDNDDIIIQDL